MFGNCHGFQRLVQFYRRRIRERWRRIGAGSAAGTVFVQVVHGHRGVLCQKFWSHFLHHVTPGHGVFGVEVVDGGLNFFKIKFFFFLCARVFYTKTVTGMGRCEKNEEITL